MKAKTLKLLKTIWKILKFLIGIGDEHIKDAEEKNTSSN